MGAAAKGPVGPLTPREIDRLVEKLPARQRAAHAWASKGVKRAVDMLLTGRLTEATIVKAAATYAAAMRPIIELTSQPVAKDPVTYAEALEERFVELHSTVHDYLGAIEPSARLIRTLWAMFLVGALAMRELAAHPERTEQFVNQAMDVDFSTLEGAGFRASVLVTAVLVAAERGASLKRARALIERADLEGWAIAHLLASVETPDGPISVPGYGVGARPNPLPPRFRTELARRLWEQRQRVIREAGGTLTDVEVEAEVAARRGGASAGC